MTLSLSLMPLKNGSLHQPSCFISKTWDTLQVLWTTTDHYGPLYCLWSGPGFADVEKGVDAIAWWLAMLTTGHSFARMALDFLSIPGMYLLLMVVCIDV